MKESSVSKNNKLAGWIDDFISSFAGKTVEENIKTAEEENTRTAEINIKDLPTVIWNDETFYVFIDEDGATIINGFGNTVTTLPDIKTVDEVNKELNGKQIVSEFENNGLEIDAEMEKEINKALAYTTITADESDDQTAQQYVNSDPYADSNQNTTNVDNTNNETNQDSNTQTDTSNQTTANVAGIKENIIAAGMYEIADELKSFDYNDRMTELIDKKLLEFEDKITDILNSKFDNLLNQKLDELTKQFYTATLDTEEESEKLDDKNELDVLDSSDTSEDELKDISIDVIDNIDNTIEDDKDDSNEYSEDNEMELPEDEVEMFKEGSCPFCNSQLVKENIDGNFVHIGCSNCDVKYKIDLDNEKIYIE